MPKSARRKKAGKSRGSGVPKSSGDSSLVYRGALRFDDKSATAAIRVRLSLYTIAVASGTGGLSVTYSNDPQSSLEWSEYALIWTSYRTLAMKIHFVPYQQNWTNLATVAANSAPVVYNAIRNGSLTSAISYGFAWGGSAVTVKSSQLPHSSTLRMNGVNDAAWQTVVTPIATFAQTCTGLGFAANQNVFGVFIEYLVEFRNREN